MRSYLKTALSGGLLLLLVGILPLSAEVKLRIYMQDGTLQAGTMVSDTPDNFVLLTKEGRVEVPKSKIMFINGKPLKYWESRTDKTYSTEIIPSEIPNPAFVNDKAALPPPVKLSDNQPIPQPEPHRPAAAAQPASASSAPKEAAATAPVKSKPVVEPVAPLAVKEKPREQPVVKKEEPVKRRRRVVKEVVKEPIPVEEVRRREPLPSGKGKFNREAIGDVHYQNAVEYMGRGEKGQAIQELHMSVLLNRYNGEAYYQLGKLYFDSGQYARAEKFFSSPTLKKRPEAKDYLAQIQEGTKQAARAKEILYAATFLGCLAWIPLVVISRRFRRPKARVISADDLVAEEVVEEEQPMPSVLRPPVVMTTEAEAEMEMDADLPAVESIPILSVYPPREMMEPMEQRQPVYAQKAPPDLESEAQAEVEEESPDLAPRVSRVSPVRARPQESLRDGRFIDRALQNGHAHAAEGRLDAANREYRTALVLDPYSLDAHLGMAYVYFAQGHMELAGEFYQRALDIHPNSADAHYGLARVYLENGFTEEAVPELQTTLSLDPNFDVARETLTALGRAA